MKNSQLLKQFHIKSKLISFIHNYYRIYNDSGVIIGYAKSKGFKLKEDLRVYENDKMKTELMSIKADRILDFSSSHVVRDSQTDTVIGIISREGLKSLARDEWVIRDPEGNEIYRVQEDSLELALVRRLFCNLIPQKFHVTCQGQDTGCHFKQNFNPFLTHYTIDIERWHPQVDKRLAVAAVLLLLSIEGRQN